MFFFMEHVAHGKTDNRTLLYGFCSDSNVWKVSLKMGDSYESTHTHTTHDGKVSDEDIVSRQKKCSNCQWKSTKYKKKKNNKQNVSGSNGIIVCLLLNSWER